MFLSFELKLYRRFTSLPLQLIICFYLLKIFRNHNLLKDIEKFSIKIQLNYHNLLNVGKI